MLAATGDVDTVQAILGHQCLDHSKPYLAVDQETIRQAYELALCKHCIYMGLVFLMARIYNVST